MFRHTCRVGWRRTDGETSADWRRHAHTHVGRQQLQSAGAEAIHVAMLRCQFRWALGNLRRFSMDILGQTGRVTRPTQAAHARHDCQRHAQDVGPHQAQRLPSSLRKTRRVGSCSRASCSSWTLPLPAGGGTAGQVGSPGGRRSCCAGKEKLLSGELGEDAEEDYAKAATQITGRNWAGRETPLTATQEEVGKVQGIQECKRPKPQDTATTPTGSLGAHQFGEGSAGSTARILLLTNCGNLCRWLNGVWKARNARYQEPVRIALGQISDLHTSMSGSQGRRP